MDEAVLVELNLCHFRGGQTEAAYTCFKSEICCDEGCCPKSTFNVFKVWYFWITVLGIIFLFSGSCKICKFGRNRRESSAARRARNASRFQQSPSSDLPNCTITANVNAYFCNSRRHDLDELMNLRQLMANQEACNIAIDRYVACQNARTIREQSNSLDPPSYNRLRMKSDASNSGEAPPKYETLCKVIGITNEENVTTSHRCEITRENSNVRIVNVDNLQGNQENAAVRNEIISTNVNSNNNEDCL